MSRPSFLRIGDVAVNVDRIQTVVAVDGDNAGSITVIFGSGDGEWSHLPITLDQFEQILRDAGRDVATVDGAA